jgi:hypothetical protein
MGTLVLMETQNTVVMEAEAGVQTRQIMEWVERVAREVLVVVVAEAVAQFSGTVIREVREERVVVERLEFILFKIFL